MPLQFEEPPTALRHLGLHNGTIWRWNRPLIGFDADGSAHLRIEHRILPAGPSMADMMANTAFYVGLVHELVASGVAEASQPTFMQAKQNFYAGARLGLEAEMAWPGTDRTSGRPAPMKRLFLPPAGDWRDSGWPKTAKASSTFSSTASNAPYGADWQRASGRQRRRFPRDDGRVL